MYTRILVAVDDSTMAADALREELALAKAHTAQVRLMRAVESPYALVLSVPCGAEPARGVF